MTSTLSSFFAQNDKHPVILFRQNDNHSVILRSGATKDLFL